MYLRFKLTEFLEVISVFFVSDHVGKWKSGNQIYSRLNFIFVFIVYLYMWSLLALSTLTSLKQSLFLLQYVMCEAYSHSLLIAMQMLWGNPALSSHSFFILT